MRVDSSVTSAQSTQSSQQWDNIPNQSEVKSELEEQDKVYGETEVIEAIEKANKEIRTYDRRLEFSIHEETKEIVVKVIDTNDDTIIREIPSEKILDMVAKMWEIAGLFVDEKR